MRQGNRVMALPKVIDALVHEPPKVFARVARAEIKDEPEATVHVLQLLRTTAKVLADGSKPHLGCSEQAKKALKTLTRTAGPLEDVVLFNYGDDPKVSWHMARFLHRADRALDSLAFFETALDHAQNNNVTEGFPETSVIMARYAEALMDAHKDMPHMAYDVRALELAMCAHRIENSPFTADLLDRLSDSNDEKLRTELGPAYEYAEALTPTALQ